MKKVLGIELAKLIREAAEETLASSQEEFLQQKKVRDVSIIVEQEKALVYILQLNGWVIKIGVTAMLLSMVNHTKGQQHGKPQP